MKLTMVAVRCRDVATDFEGGELSAVWPTFPPKKNSPKIRKTPDLGHLFLESGGTSPPNLFTAGDASPPPAPASEAHGEVR